ncbi:MAG: polysaccharide biosynthesis protein [Clostridia bacterium]|nr:polysaccharide biosynthesis protein [Clostridia bacterium]
MQKPKRYSVINGAFMLAVSTLIVKLIGMLYKIPLTNFIGAVGRGYFSTAYGVFSPVFSIATIGLPVAISRLVSQNMALGYYKQVQGILRVSVKCFLITGSIGSLVVLLVAKPYAHYIAQSPNAIYSIFMIAPSIFFCCIAAAFRGYYEGQSNMYPTAISQLIEAVCKMALGIGIAEIIMKTATSEFLQKGTVFGEFITDESELLIHIYPYTAAGAILGVTIGEMVATLYLIICQKIKGGSFTKQDLLLSPEPENDREIFKSLLRFALPVMIGGLTMNLVSIIDSSTIQNRLAYAINTDSELIRKLYNISYEIPTSDISAYLYGCYNSAMDFKNLIPTITGALGISALPALASAWKLKNQNRIENTVSMVTRLTVFIAMPAGFVLAVMARPILSLVYSQAQADIVNAATPVLQIYGVVMVLFSLSAPIISMLHAIGEMTMPIKSLIIGALFKITLNVIFVAQPKFNINGAIFGTITSTLIMVVLNFVHLLRKTKVKINFTMTFIKPFICSIACALSAYGSFSMLQTLIPHRLATVFSVTISIFIYIFVTFLVRGIYANDIKMFSFGEKIAKTLEKLRIVR